MRWQSKKLPATPPHPDEGKTGKRQPKKVSVTNANQSRTMQTPTKPCPIKWFRHNPPAHTHHHQKSSSKHTQHTTNPQTKKYIGTLSSSHTTHAHPTQPSNNQAGQAARDESTQPVTKSQNRSKQQPRQPSETTVMHLKHPTHPNRTNPVAVTRRNINPNPPTTQTRSSTGLNGRR